MSSAKSFTAARLANKKRKLAHDAADSLEAETSATLNSSKKVGKKPKKEVVKREAFSSQLPWKNIMLPTELGFDEDGGLLELDEVDDVEVVYADGRATFKVKEDKLRESEVEKKQAPDKQRKLLYEHDGKSSYDSPFGEESAAELKQLQRDGWIVEGLESGTEEVSVEKTKTIAKRSLKGKGKQKEETSGSVKNGTDDEYPEENFDVENLMPEWKGLTLPPKIYRALAELGFDKPTDIQRRVLSVEKPLEKTETANTLPPSGAYPAGKSVFEEQGEEWGGIGDDAQLHAPVLENAEDEYVSAFPTTYEGERDIVGVAQTGSGKTLAYGLPILSYIFSQPPPEPGTSRLSALVLAPTRELALQVRAALADVALRTNKLLPEDQQHSDPKVPRRRQKGRWVNVVALTGGMSIDKQKRQLSRGADIIIATPGRLWDLLGDDDELVKSIKQAKFLVIDEADRMIENGHFAELDNIVRLTRRKNESETDGFVDEFKSAVTSHSLVNALPCRADMRTFVFSATMSKDLQRNLKRKGRKIRPGQPEDGMSSLDDLLLKLDFRDEDPEIIDLSPEGGLVETLKECKIECMVPEKDAYLYHFLLRYPGRTIVFLSSIDGIRRLQPLLTLLGLHVLSLHSGMQQRARLKSLDRFKAAENAVLLATDVAARGLDIPAVSHVVHYQLPRTADTYVHRSGRTARAGQGGLALQLCAPEEKQTQRLLMASLGKGVDLPVLPVEFSILDKLKGRIELAKKIDAAEHKATKEAHDDNWLRQAAEAMEIDIESDSELFNDEDSGRKSKRASKGKASEVKTLKAELQALLKKPITMRGISAKYLTTRNAVGFVDQLIDGKNHSDLLGVETSTALADLSKVKKGSDKK